MSMSDPIADMLTRIRNAQAVGMPDVEMPSSKMKASIAKVLEEEGYIRGFAVSADEAGRLRLKIRLSYYKEKPVIAGLRRVSRPGLRIYRGADGMPRVLGNMGVVIVSTSKGVMSGRAAKAMREGGEIICVVE